MEAGIALVAAVIPAGGVGTRLKSRVHKPFVRLGGRPLLAWTVQAFEAAPVIDLVVLVTHPGDLAAARRLVRRYRLSKVIAVVAGGETRMRSVANGLAALPAAVGWVAVHDAARPLVTRRLIEATVRAARGRGGAKAAIAAVPVVPTIKEATAAGDWVRRTIPRERLWAVQTPQVFERGLLEQAHAYGRNHRIKATDDAALVEGLRRRVKIVMGSSRNIKVTTPEDLVIAEALLRKKD